MSAKNQTQQLKVPFPGRLRPLSQSHLQKWLAASSPAIAASKRPSD